MIMRVVTSEGETTTEIQTPEEHARSILEKVLLEKPTGIVIIYETPTKRLTKWKSSPDSDYAEKGLIDAAYELIHGVVEGE